MIKTTITLSDSGFVSISDAIAVGEVKQESIKGEGQNELVQNLRLTDLQIKSKVSSVAAPATLPLPL